MAFDADVFLSADPEAPIDMQAATLRSFSFNADTVPVLLGAAAAGLFAFVVGMVTIRGPTPTSPRRLWVLLVTVIMSIFIAAVLSLLHLPERH